MLSPSDSHYVGPPHPTEMRLGNFTKPPNSALFRNDVSTGHIIEKKNEKALIDSFFEEAFTGFYWCHGPMRHEALESFIFIRSKLFVIETFSFHMLNLRCKRCHHYRWLSIYKVYLRCVFNLGTKSGSVLPCSIHRLKYMLYIPVRGTFLGLRLCMQK